MCTAQCMLLSCKLNSEFALFLECFLLAQTYVWHDNELARIHCKS